MKRADQTWGDWFVNELSRVFEVRPDDLDPDWLVRLPLPDLEELTV